jgi:regulator of sigma E protease
VGLAGVEPGMRLVAAGDNAHISSAHDLNDAVEKSGGRAVDLRFVKNSEGGAAAGPVSVTVQPVPELEREIVGGESGAAKAGADAATPALGPIEHLAGLTPAMSIQTVVSEGAKALGLREGDVFAQIGARTFPRVDEGITEIRAHKGGKVHLEVLRKGDGGTWTRLPMDASVDSKGQIGFGAAQAESGTLVSLPPEWLTPIGADAKPYTPPAFGVVTRAGSRVLSVNGEAVSDFGQIRAALLRAIAGASGDQPVTVKLGLELPLPAQGDGKPAAETREMTLAPRDVAALKNLGWKPPFETAGLFKVEEIILKADAPGVGARMSQAVHMGLAETKRVMLTTYLTFARLFDGTVKVEHLKGPVGIAHLGTQVAEQGLIKLFFFMALISVNLAVINFLPLPIVDGGQFIFLLVEQIRGRPVPLGIQNAATIAGLILIGAVFVLTTFNDILHIFQG